MVNSWFFSYLSNLQGHCGVNNSQFTFLMIMKQKFRLCILIAVLMKFFLFSFETRMNAAPVGNQSVKPTSGYSGRYFLTGFMQNEILIVGSGLRLSITISTYKPTNIRIAAPINKPSIFLQLPADTVIELVFSYSNVEMFESEIAMYKSIEIEADQPITVSGLSSQDLSTDGYSALPVSKWGLEYVVHSWPNDTYKHDTDPTGIIPRSSEFMIIASVDNTTIAFTPRARTEKGIPAGTTKYITLNKGQCYLVKSDSLPAGQGDLSGTIVVGDKPIGVFSGHLRTSIPMGLTDYDSKNHLTEMLYPTSVWGKQFATIPFINSGSGDFLRVHCIKPNTTVQVKGQTLNQTITLQNPGDFETLNFVREPLLIVSDKPASVVQYMSTSFASIPSLQDYDPCMVLVPPTDQFVTLTRFHVISDHGIAPSKFSKHYVNLICSADAVDYINLDKRSVKSIVSNIQNQRINGADLFFASVPVTPGIHTLSTSEGSFIAALYGTGTDDAYGYPIAFGMEFGIDTSAPVITITDSCGNLNGMVKEILKDSVSGIHDITVIRDSSWNYNWTIPALRDDEVTAYFSASIISRNKDASLLIEAIDNAGNVSRYRFKYSAPKLSIADTIFISETIVGDSLCIPFTIVNNGNEPITLRYVYVQGDKQIAFNKNVFSLDYKTIQAGDTAFTMLCYKPVQDTAAAMAFITVELMCGTYAKIPVIATASQPSIEVHGFDFNNVRVGKSKIAYIKVINKGTSPFTLTDFKSEGFLQNGIFTFDTNKRFPIVLQAKDTILFNCLFKPQQPIHYEQNFTFINDKNLENSGIVKGNGIQPKLEGFIIDWKERRIGTKHSSYALIQNTGNDSITVTLDSPTHLNGIFTTSFSNGNNSVMLPANTIDTVFCSFNPEGAMNYVYNGTIASNDSLVPSIQYALMGIGTVPSIVPHDIYVGSIIEKTFKDTSGLLFSNGGNEKLTVDSLRIASGDISSFTIDTALLTKKIFDIGSSYNIPITFHPKWTGKHELFVEVYSDAAPNFERVRSLIRIYGEATSIDTLSATIAHTLVSPIRVCNDKLIGVKVTNTGNRKLSLDSVYCISNFPGIDSISIQPIVLPIDLQPKADTTIYFLITSLTLGNDSLSFFAVLNDSIVLQTQAFIIFRPNYLTFGKSIQSAITFTPGEDVQLSLSGSFDAPYTDAALCKPVIEIKFSPAALSGKFGATSINFTSNNSTVQLPANVNVANGHITINSQTVIPLKGYGNWIVSIPVQTFLCENPGSALATIFNTENACFVTDTTIIPLIETGICAPGLRVVSGDMQGNGFLGTSPHPLKSSSTASFLLQDNQDYTIELIDILGKVQWRTQEKGAKGLNKVTLELGNLANGNYILVFQTLNAHTSIPVLVNIE